ncbi:hypothetical protein NECAME_10583 [Necator americanus]|uniref:Uncharacterized protein n=1 Tax=Necator americanus TaxID=51031 RepID=W2T7W0_NECAM|nr:hypothetical protein NECAME_10583 [Necator americanus]ETN78105.1 hypothetical protein NECAME_10583 [Necator americanus]
MPHPRNRKLSGKMPGHEDSIFQLQEAEMQHFPRYQLITEMLNGLGAQLGAWEKFEDPKAGVISYFHKAFYKTFIDSGMKDFAVEVIKKYPGFRVWNTVTEKSLLIPEEGLVR